jgi:amino acid permease
MQLSKLLEVSRWFVTFPPPPGPINLVAVAFFVLWTIASIGVYRFRRRLFAGNGARIGMATRFGPYAITIGVIGLILLGCRYAEIPYLSMRFLLYLTGVSALGFLGFLAYYHVWRYPAKLAEVRAHELRRRYEPRPRKKRRR